MDGYCSRKPVGAPFMLVFRFCLLAFLSSALGTSFAQGWSVYADQEYFFSINFLGEPEIREFDYDAEYGGTYPARVYFTEEGQSLYSLTVIDFTDNYYLSDEYQKPTDQTDDAPVERLWLYDMRGSMTREAAKLRQQSSEVLYDAWHHINQVEGRQLVVTNPDQSNSYAGLYLYDKRLYFLKATAPAGSPPPGLFQQSLSFINNEGEPRILLLTPEGSIPRSEGSIPLDVCTNR